MPHAGRVGAVQGNDVCSMGFSSTLNLATDALNVFAIPGCREPVNCFSHLLAAVFYSVLSVYLIRKGRGSWLRTASLSIMAFSTVFLLSMSAAYHLVSPGDTREILRQLDIAGVFLLIAGTMTPIHAILDCGSNRGVSLLLIWSVAVAGITLRTVFSDSLPSGGGIAIFLLFGWSGLFTFIRLWRRYGYCFVEPVFWGGIAYSAGAVVLAQDWLVLLPGVVSAHEVWHVAVLIGLGLHWRFVFQFAEGPPAAVC
jgi:channel protein (hemolysin III family)